MPVSMTLQDLVADLSASIAAKRALTHADQIRMRRSLSAAADELRAEERRSVVAHHTAAELADAIDAGVANLGGVAARARTQLGEAR